MIVMIKRKRQKKIGLSIWLLLLCSGIFFIVVSYICLQSMWHMIKFVHLHRETKETWHVEEEITSWWKTVAFVVPSRKWILCWKIGNVLNKSYSIPCSSEVLVFWKWLLRTAHSRVVSYAMKTLISSSACAGNTSVFQPFPWLLDKPLS